MLRAVGTLNNAKLCNLYLDALSLSLTHSLSELFINEFRIYDNYIWQNIKSSIIICEFESCAQNSFLVRWILLNRLIYGE